MWTKLYLKGRGEERGRYILEAVREKLGLEIKSSECKVLSVGLVRDLIVKIRSSGCRLQVRGRLRYITAIHVKDKEQNGLKLA